MTIKTSPGVSIVEFVSNPRRQRSQPPKEEPLEEQWLDERIRRRRAVAAAKQQESEEPDPQDKTQQQPMVACSAVRKRDEMSAILHQRMVESGGQATDLYLSRLHAGKPAQPTVKAKPAEAPQKPAPAPRSAPPKKLDDTDLFERIEERGELLELD